jgi:hypothetical protein
MVVVVEPDGRQGRQLISSDDGLNEPLFISDDILLQITDDSALAWSIKYIYV